MKNQLIKDQDYEQALNEMGFCVATIFTAAQIDQIKNLYEQYSISNKVSGLIASHSKTGPEHSLQISNSIKEVLMPSLEEWFRDFNFFLGGFMVKEANTSSEFPLHQDWNILDETKYTSYQIWIPLELSSPYNGGIFVLPGSHRFFENNRSGSYGMPRVDTDDKLRELTVNMIIPPGSALVYHNSIFHASYPNKTNTDRVSVIINVYQKDATLEYAHRNKELNRTEKYSINTTSFLTHLNTFEKGYIPADLSEFTVCASDNFDNGNVKSKDLTDGFLKVFPKGKESFEPLQLHILNDASIEEKLKRDGYVTLDLIDSEVANELKKEYEKFFQTSNTDIGRFTPMEHSTPESKRYIHDFIIDKIQDKLDFYFKDYQTPIASYFTKYANSAGDLSWHHDASIILNTHLDPHYGIWCPLIDVDENNGAFCLVEKSHKFSHSVFLAGLQWPFADYLSFFDKTKKTTPIKAGQMVLFDLRLIHHAMPNKSEQDRVVFCVRLTHKKSKYYSFESIDTFEQSVVVFEEQSDYYLRDDWSGDNQAANQLKKVGTMSHIYSSIDYRKIKSLMRNAGMQIEVMQ